MQQVSDQYRRLVSQGARTIHYNTFGYNQELPCLCPLPLFLFKRHLQDFGFPLFCPAIPAMICYSDPCAQQGGEAEYIRMCDPDKA